MSETPGSRHIFLSYCREDAQIMHRLRDALRAAGLSVWTDESLEPGTASWKAAIEQAIEQSGGLVVILSPRAKRSEWVERELDYAQAQGVRIFPVLVRGDARSAIPLELVNAQWVDLRSESGYRAGEQALINAIRIHLGQPAAAPPQPAVARPTQGASSFFRRWWRVGACALSGFTLYIINVGYVDLLCGALPILLMAGVGIDHLANRRWARSGLFLAVALSWLTIVLAGPLGAPLPIELVAIFGLFVAGVWALIDAATNRSV